ncbi:hypothetical protein D3C86_1955330 [compost metagenome]
MDVCPADENKFEYTWNKIQQGLNSLSRKTNTPLLLDFIESLIEPAAEQNVSTVSSD